MSWWGRVGGVRFWWRRPRRRSSGGDCWLFWRAILRRGRMRIIRSCSMVLRSGCGRCGRKERLGVVPEWWNTKRTRGLPSDCSARFHGSHRCAARTKGATCSAGRVGGSRMDSCDFGCEFRRDIRRNAQGRGRDDGHAAPHAGMLPRELFDRATCGRSAEGVVSEGSYPDAG
jgi:hypothetical protein